jgi:hypothetical protein
LYDERERAASSAAREAAKRFSKLFDICQIVWSAKGSCGYLIEGQLLGTKVSLSNAPSKELSIVGPYRPASADRASNGAHPGKYI